MCRDSIRDSKGAEELSGYGDSLQVRFGKSDGEAKKNDTKKRGGPLGMCVCMHVYMLPPEDLPFTYLQTLIYVHTRFMRLGLTF